MTSLPLYTYPTTITCIDDDELFLKQIHNILNKKYRLKQFHCPQVCIEYFKVQNVPILDSYFMRGCVEHEYHDTAEHFLIDINIPSLHKIHQHAERLNEVSVIIVDFNMPAFNGLELCKKLLNYPMKKILLTGYAEENQAIAAFNANMIDRFVRKDSPNLNQELTEYVEVLSRAYFRDRTKTLLTQIEVENRIALSDPVFIEYFAQWCKEEDIVEYSIFDKQGSILAIDKNNNQKYFIIHTDRSLNAFADLNDDVFAARKHVNNVKHRREIPFFGVGKECWEYDIDQWDQHFYTTKKIVGREPYYIAIVN